MNYGADREVFSTYSENLTYDNFVKHQKFALPPVLFETEFSEKVLGGDYKHPVYLETPTSKVIGDGAAFEFNYRKPYTNAKEFYSVIHENLERLMDYTMKHDLEVCTLPVVNFDYKRFWNEESMKDERFLYSVIFGCDEDFDAFNPEWGCKIVNAETHPYRYGGGHLHFSGDDWIERYPLPFIKMLAICVGNYVNANAKNTDLLQLRAQYYGKPGRYRLPEYPNGMKGVEYRTPSNEWLNFSLDEFVEMFEMAEKALDILKHPEIGREVLKEYSYPTIEAICSANKEKSNIILKSIL